MSQHLSGRQTSRELTSVADTVEALPSAVVAAPTLLTRAVSSLNITPRGKVACSCAPVHSCLRLQGIAGGTASLTLQLRAQLIYWAGLAGSRMMRSHRSLFALRTYQNFPVKLLSAKAQVCFQISMSRVSRLYCEIASILNMCVLCR